MRKTVAVAGSLILSACLCPAKGKGAQAVALKAPADQGYSAQDEARQNDYSSDKEVPYKRMAQELSGSAGLLTSPKIAILPFVYGDKQKPEVGMMVSERLTTRIVKLHTFKVIERQLLENVLQELHLEGTGVMDAETTKKLGKVLGVEAIITGTILNLNNNRAEINARLIQTDTAEVIATASEEIYRSWDEERAPQNAGQEQEYRPVERRKPAQVRMNMFGK